MRILKPTVRALLCVIAGSAVLLAVIPTPYASIAKEKDQSRPANVELPSPRPDLKKPKPKSWPFVPWSYAKAYTYNFADSPANILEVVDAKGTWNTRLRSEQLISDAQTVRAAALVGQTQGTFETTKCTVPRHAVVLFDRNDKPVAAASVCFDCEGILVWPDYDRPEDYYHKPDTYDKALVKFEAALEQWRGLFGTELGLPIDYKTVP